MRLAIVGAVLLVAGIAAVAVGALPVGDLVALIDRTAPILAFVVAMTVVTELASEAGVFLWIARRLRHWGRGYSLVLWLLVAVSAALCTIFLSLDTTAVLLTPVVVSVTRQAGLPVLPFALTTVWLANTASLLLPISNLSNLLAQHSLGSVSPAGFAALMWAPSLAAALVPLVFICIVFRRDLRKRYPRIPVNRIRSDRHAVGERSRGLGDRMLLVIAAAVLALLLPALVSGVVVWIPAAGAAVVLLAAFAVRRPRVLKVSLVPWSLLLFAAGLFVVMETARHLGAPLLFAALAGEGDGTGDLVRLAASGGLTSNVLNNLPAYLLAEPVAGTPERLAALLIGVNAGPLITPWASLATLLWHDRLARMNVMITWKGYAVFGLIVAPLTVLLAALALAATGW
ncbi:MULTISPECIES: SLC13 family permease [Arthrobacter]|uniref:Arsenic transporter n=1 Tax=Arthrobacter terricola TaxID=2547396 RepID=A0A4R5KQ39_9MICC|nr:MULTISPECIES: SLC13 family permease [Arthrobacter]MBT8160700.1 arsenic transporter [Arthrobacter sp. GN70]TDF97853.1 arsenic transporter [Arthrobacter terricola]